MPDPSVLLQKDGKILIVTINRPEARNAVDSATARALGEAFQQFDHDGALHVAVLTGADGTFCAGADRARWPKAAAQKLNQPAPDRWDLRGCG